jgi:hypothetical protein
LYTKIKTKTTGSNRSSLDSYTNQDPYTKTQKLADGGAGRRSSEGLRSEKERSGPPLSTVDPTQPSSAGEDGIGRWRGRRLGDGEDIGLEATPVRWIEADGADCMEQRARDLTRARHAAARARFGVGVE